MALKCFYFLLLFSTITTGCYRMRASNGGAQIKTIPTRKLNAADVALPPGYVIEPVISGLTFPSAATFDEAGNLYIIETGYAYGEVWEKPRLLRIEKGNKTVIAEGTQNGPWNGISFYNGAFYVAEGGEREGGRILKITKDGKITTLISNLPSMGDHHTNGPVIKDGYIYFATGTATNSGVVGPDNSEYGWLKRFPEFKDVPCKDVTLAGINYTSANVLDSNSTAQVSTGAFVPFGTSTTAGQIIKGKIPCSGAVMRIALNGGAPELVAWGLRNPYGLALAPNGTLYATENAFDDRGSRPVWGAGDVLWEIKNDAWYGFPDFSAGQPIWNKEEFKVPGKDEVKKVLEQFPSEVPKPAAVLGVHSSSNGLDFSRSDVFGFNGEAFIAQLGDMAPKVGKVLAPVGFKVVRVNVNTGVVRDFAVNKGKRNGPASWLKKGGLERPISVKFDPSGTALYVVDFGTIAVNKNGVMPQKGTGAIWKITKQGL